MSVQRLANESAEYLKLREELLEAEIALRDQRERVAELRRALPPTAVQDYVFREAPLAGGPVAEVQLSELFGAHETLLLMHFMFGRQQESPCPMCTMWADGYDGVVSHITQRAAFGVVVEGDPERFREHAQGRGWRNLRLLSSGDTSFKDDLAMQSPEGHQFPGVSVFTRGADGAVAHTYTGGAALTSDQWRGMDLLSPVWHFLDLTPGGRVDWMPRLSYG
jgi:predicted dithiol-disulfide oxidoreductase (DUF899 family)